MGNRFLSHSSFYVLIRIQTCRVADPRNSWQRKTTTSIAALPSQADFAYSVTLVRTTAIGEKSSNDSPPKLQMRPTFRRIKSRKTVLIGRLSENDMRRNCQKMTTFSGLEHCLHHQQNHP